MTDLPRAVLFDIDGTLAIRDESDPNVRHFAAWDRVGEDLPNAAVIELAQMVAESGRYKLIVMSGRDEVCRRQTEMWLDAQGVAFDELHMRTHTRTTGRTRSRRRNCSRHTSPADMKWPGSPTTARAWLRCGDHWG